ncbi:glycosyltransferase family A protein [Microbacterium sulfonylureivorans]|uniref:glycosyltransferase family A protein n=1 Tax=Microbacterium sulfonylureivorans TaxID=2486854 RepID=UPI0013E09F77|nr:glycosyltransferase family A protein [Microbacterium sulfonylureivorans]
MATNRVSPFLAAALESLADQTHPRVEVIVVDDGSPDPEAIEATVMAATPSARILRRSPAGVSAARNAGASAATGELLVFFDDDDLSAPERLSRQATRLSSTPAAVACYCGMRTIDAEGRVLVEADQTAVRDRLDVARRRTGILLGNLMVRRTEFEAVGGFDTSLTLAEDLDLVLNLSERGDFVFEPEALFDYRLHGGNNTSRHRELTASIDRIVRTHRSRAQLVGDSALADAHSESLRANARFAWWGAMRHARGEVRAKRWGPALSDAFWAARIAPSAPFDAVGRRLRRR